MWARSLHVVIRDLKDPETGERPQRYASEEANFERIGQLIRQFRTPTPRTTASWPAWKQASGNESEPISLIMRNYLSWKLCRYMQRLSMNVVYKLIEVGSYAIL